MKKNKDKPEDSIKEWVLPKELKLPYSHYHGNGLYEVFDGTSSIYMGKELHERFKKLLLEESLKYKQI